MKEKKQNNCVYFHINPLKSEIFYVGIGNLKRPYRKTDRNNWWKRIIAKYGYIIDIAHINLSWEEAVELEKYYIKKIGRKDLGLGSLVNLTNGGDGQSKGFKHSEKTIRKFSEIRKGKGLGRKLSKETIAKLKARVITQEDRNKKSKSKLEKPTKYWLGKKRPDVTERNKNAKNPFRDPKILQKSIDARKGKPAWNKGMSRQEMSEYKNKK